MLTSEETGHIRHHAYIPEHIVPYVTAISKAEPFLIDDFVCYLRKGTLIFIGYPLHGAFTEQTFLRALQDARKRWKPETLSVIAPTASTPLESCALVSSDHYHGLPLPMGKLRPKLSNMIRRASKDITITQDHDLGESHLGLIYDFLLTRQTDDATRVIFQSLPDYVAASSTAVIFSARLPDGSLATFSIGEYWGVQTVIYMFNFTSRRKYVPGASDLLLSVLLRKAESRGNNRANLGLGISKGVTFFKGKWGAEKMCQYNHYICEERGGKGFSAFFRGVLSR